MGKERLRALAISLVVISTVPALAQMTGWVNIIPEGPGIAHLSIEPRGRATETTVAIHGTFKKNDWQLYWIPDSELSPLLVEDSSFTLSLQWRGIAASFEMFAINEEGRAERQRFRVEAPTIPAATKSALPSFVPTSPRPPLSPSPLPSETNLPSPSPSPTVSTRPIVRNYLTGSSCMGACKAAPQKTSGFIKGVWSEQTCVFRICQGTAYITKDVTVSTPTTPAKGTCSSTAIGGGPLCFENFSKMANDCSFICEVKNTQIAPEQISPSLY
ncbi:MAG: hypothetical protein A2Z97_00025 [Bdellovibrionales bacterium GWB1_52_6]|nr:MAG: hypothetical protein A2Z97_00025 [Bdellovibrionales bacterium GWB1_52_6]OFZ04526.1 MAG: hypothetical protein A2X97_12940 [Bdellovibrionales bacterium GWA1_52_35]HCM39930.1 hypothetical protein [Bdellovibrionales bacterium]